MASNPQAFLVASVHHSTNEKHIFGLKPIENKWLVSVSYFFNLHQDALVHPMHFDAGNKHHAPGAQFSRRPSVATLAGNEFGELFVPFDQVLTDNRVIGNLR